MRIKPFEFEDVGVKLTSPTTLGSLLDRIKGNILFINSCHRTLLCNLNFIKMQRQEGSCIFQTSNLFRNKC